MLVEVNFESESHQDRFAISILKNKRNGFFVELGSASPKFSNNTFFMELYLGWHGIMVEMDPKYEASYKEIRHNSVHVMKNALDIDYKELFKKHNVPKNIDYLQVDLDVNNNSTLELLYKLEKEVMDEYKFACITFETDHYLDRNNTKEISREIFKRHGYELVFCIKVPNTDKEFEDWYCFPNLVDMELVNKVKMKSFDKPIDGRLINYDVD